GRALGLVGMQALGSLLAALTLRGLFNLDVLADARMGVPRLRALLGPEGEITLGGLVSGGGAGVRLHLLPDRGGVRRDGGPTGSRAGRADPRAGPGGDRAVRLPPDGGGGQPGAVLRAGGGPADGDPAASDPAVRRAPRLLGGAVAGRRGRRTVLHGG